MTAKLGAPAHQQRRARQVGSGRYLDGLEAGSSTFDAAVTASSSQSSRSIFSMVERVLVCWAAHVNCVHGRAAARGRTWQPEPQGVAAVRRASGEPGQRDARRTGFADARGPAPRRPGGGAALREAVDGKVVLVTGASSGIGPRRRRPARRRGGPVLLVARSEDLLDEVRREIAAGEASHTPTPAT